MWELQNENYIRIKTLKNKNFQIYLTRIEQRGRISSLDLLAVLFLMHPRIPWAFLATRTTLLVRGHLVAHQDPLVLVCRAAFQQIESHPLLVQGFILPQVQDPPLTLCSTSDSSSPPNSILFRFHINDRTVLNH